MKRKTAILTAGLLLCAMLFGCGGKAVSKTKGEAVATPVGESASDAKTADGVGSPYGEYLTLDEVEDITGITGLTATEEGAILRFTDSDGGVAYEARFYSADFYEAEVEGNRKYYEDVPGVGDKAAICIPDSPYRLTFVKGDRCVMTQTLSNNADGELMVSEEQLISIAKSIASKLPD
jgi:hypothetical protein